MINNTWTVILNEDGSQATNCQDLSPVVQDNVGGMGQNDTDLRGYDGQALCGNYVVGVVSWCGQLIDGSEDPDYFNQKKRPWYEGLYIAGSADDVMKDGLGMIATRPVHDEHDSDGMVIGEVPGQVKWLRIRSLGNSVRLPEDAYTFFFGANIVGIDGAVMVNSFRKDHSESWVVRFDTDGNFVSEDFIKWDPKYGYLPAVWVLDDPGFKAGYTVPGHAGGSATFDPFKTQEAGGGIQPYMSIVPSGNPDELIYSAIAFRDALVWSVLNKKTTGRTWVHSDGPTATPFPVDDLYFTDGSEDAEGRVVVISWDDSRPASSPNGPPVFIAVWGDSDYIPEFIDFSITGDLLGGDARFETGGAS